MAIDTTVDKSDARLSKGEACLCKVGWNVAKIAVTAVLRDSAGFKSRPASPWTLSAPEIHISEGGRGG